jgi:hypothetical protein
LNFPDKISLIHLREILQKQGWFEHHPTTNFTVNRHEKDPVRFLVFPRFAFRPDQ